MKKNLYYQTMFQRRNLILDILTDIFISLASYPRLMIEVFIRKNFGQRYFNMAAVYSITVITSLGILTSSGFFKYLFFLFKSLQYPYSYDYPFEWLEFVKDYWIWVAYMAVFISVSKKRAIEIKHNPSTFDFEKFSLYAGDINPKFYSLFNRQWNVRQVEMIVEPIIFFTLGLAITFTLNASFGLMLMVISIIYSLSYWAAYRRGTEFVLDKIDDMICKKEMFNSFVKKEDVSKTKGFRFIGPTDIDEAKKEELFKTFFEDEDEEIGVAK
ncbi:MAG TPA: hypothetical protein PLN13_03495 [Bacteroidia bacterium]|nr:hypothetical protein [Bacteroidia bacterium]HRH07619.1 hypothetical protein [Bacteroidia bacterium]